MTRILYFQATDKSSARQKLKGVHAYGHAHGWDVQVIEPGADERKAANLVDFWTPDGILVECGSERNLFRPEIFAKAPVVFLDRNPKTLSTQAFCVVHDSSATAQLAARELLALKLAAYAYVPWPAPRFWSEMREQSFAKALQLNNRSYSRFPGKARSADTRALQQELGVWLRGLSKPVGIFAANDALGAQVVAAATRLGLKIPDDIALIGVDNDELVCENTSPTLTSVMPDFRAAGEIAAEMLAHRLANPNARPSTKLFGPLRLVRRASTNRMKRIDHEVLAALDLIRREACSGLTARQVVARFPCSRRMAEIRFRTATGHSILDEIQSIRKERALELLKDPSLDRTAVANFCGYASGKSLMNFLRGA